MEIATSRGKRLNENRGWPNREQELVLRSAVMHRDDALDAWTQLGQATTVEDLDRASQGLLPLVFRNFEKHELDTREWPMLKSIYRWAWTRNQILFKVGRSALERLDSAGIDALLLKGAALVHLDYQDAGVRPMADLDVLVRPGDVEGAVAVLGSLGWTSQSSRSPSRLAALYADELRNDLGQGLDLHWRVLMSPEPEDDLWRDAVPLTLAGVETRSLSAADRLLHVCAHGLVPNEPLAIRWVADAATIMRRHEIDWARLVDQARRRQVSLSIGRALAYLTRAIEAPVPPQVVEELNRGPHSRVEIAAHKAAMSPVSLYEVVRWHWYRYRRVEPRRLRAAMGFPGYLRMLLGYDRRRSFALHVARRLASGRKEPSPAGR